MAKVREYEGTASEIGGRIVARESIRKEPDFVEPVTAIDERDVEPLVEAALELDHACDRYNRGATWHLVKAAQRKLAAALAPFDKESGS